MEKKKEGKETYHLREELAERGKKAKKSTSKPNRKDGREKLLKRMTRSFQQVEGIIGKLQSSRRGSAPCGTDIWEERPLGLEEVKQGNVEVVRKF